MSESSDEIIFNIIPDPYVPPGRAAMIVSYEDFEKMRQHGWNLEKPDWEFSDNRLKIQLRPSEAN